MNNELFAAELIKQFSGIWPSLRATMRPEDIFEYQVQMIKALTENGLNTQEAIQKGFRMARTEGGQYLPSVPEFVRWCRPVKQYEQNYKIAAPQKIVTSEDQLRYSQFSKNLLELIK
jgi:hypothetical protein